MNESDKRRLNCPQMGMESYLTEMERDLFNVFIHRAKMLDKRGGAGSYGTIAEVSEDVSAAKEKGKSAIPILARGLENLTIDQIQTQTKRRKEFFENFKKPLIGLAIGIYIILTVLAFIAQEHFSKAEMTLASDIFMGLGWTMGVVGFCYLLLSEAD